MSENSRSITRPTSVLIADDHPIVRAALAEWIAKSDGLELCATATDGPEVLDLCRTLRPDVAVVDLDMPRLDGVEVTKALSRSCPGTKTIIYTGLDSTVEALRAYRAGAFAFVVKTSTMSTFDAVIREVAAGRRHFPREMIDDLAGHLLVAGNMGRAADEPLSELTDREREVFLWIAKGNTTRQIADRMGVTTRTVTRHKSRIHDKFGTASDAELARLAVHLHLLPR